MSSVLSGYLSLRRLVVQRTKLVDQTEERLLELLEDMTTGTAEETRAFMAVCVDTVERYPQVSKGCAQVYVTCLGPRGQGLPRFFKRFRIVSLLL